MLLDLRHDLVAQKHQTGRMWDLTIKTWEKVNASPRLFEWGGKAARVALNLGLDRVVPNPLGRWKQNRDFPAFAPKPFRQLWRERQTGHEDEQ